MYFQAVPPQAHQTAMTLIKLVDDAYVRSALRLVLENEPGVSFVGDCEGVALSGRPEQRG
jgi:hypothetical protein